MNESIEAATARSLFPLCVDLDGTLIRTDSLHESVAQLAKHDLGSLWRLPLWLSQGKAHLKTRLAERVELDVESLPYRAELLAWIREQAEARPVYLVTAAAQSIADAVAQHLDCFTGTIATSGDVNLSAERKAGALVARFGAAGFDYAGNSADDLPVWRVARQAIVVDAPSSVLSVARSNGNVAATFDIEQTSMLTTAKLWIRALRIYQWVKNLLIFLAPLAAHQILVPSTFMQCAVAFFSFGFAASAIYIVNDLLDLSVDRGHPRKRNRPFASGRLSIQSGVVAVPMLLSLSILLGAQVTPRFVAVLLAYVLLTTLYSFWLKRKPFTDTFALSALYTIRVVAGAFAASLGLSFWLLAFCGYGFLSLALLKRYGELIDLRARGADSTPGRGYAADDTNVVLALGVSAGMASSLVMALYIDSQVSQLRYSHPEFLWVLVALLTWGIGRLWLIATRGNMTDDPIVFVATDKVSLVLVVIAVAAIACAL